MEYWSNGVMEYWSNGILECWNTGVLEYWSVGVRKTDRRRVPNTPSLHYSSTLFRQWQQL